MRFFLVDGRIPAYAPIPGKMFVLTTSTLKFVSIFPQEVLSYEGSQEITSEEFKKAVLGFEVSLLDEFYESKQLAQPKNLSNSTTWIGGYKYDLTPLHDAALKDNSEELKRLLKTGINVNEIIDNDVRPLHMAAMNKPNLPWRERAGAVQILLDSGADIEAQTIDEGFTALHLAIIHRSVTKTQTLLAAGANPNT